MGLPGKPDEALFFTAISFRQEMGLAEVQRRFMEPFGTIFTKSDIFPFDYSCYYESEMGSNLAKIFTFYEGLFDIERFVSMKQQAIKLEVETSENGNRSINIDPGYLSLAKLVLATTKNFDHRLYLGGGIFGDIQLRYRRGEFTVNPWTYPDYKAEASINYFKNARNYLHKLIKQK